MPGWLTCRKVVNCEAMRAYVEAVRNALMRMPSLALLSAY